MPLKTPRLSRCRVNLAKKPPTEMLFAHSRTFRRPGAVGVPVLGAAAGAVTGIRIKPAWRQLRRY